MTGSNKAENIRKLFDGYRTKQRAVVENLLADDFTFTSPYDDRISKAAYFERCWPASIDYIRSNTLEQVCEAGDTAFVLYKCTAADGRDFRNTEHFTFRDSKVSAINVYFGATYKDGVFLAQQPDA
jgi:ketosteroid isomerase-like protein